MGKHSSQQSDKLTTDMIVCISITAVAVLAIVVYFIL